MVAIKGTQIVENFDYENEVVRGIYESKGYTFHEDDSQAVLDVRAQIEADKVEAEQQVLKNEAQAYLDNTDWYVVRKSETGVEIPEDVLTKRAECREVL